MRFEVHGTSRKTGEVIVIVIDADNAREASRKALSMDVDASEVHASSDGRASLQLQAQDIRLKFQIVGKCRKTGEVLTLVIKAFDAIDATLEGDKMGIDVLSATPVTVTDHDQVNREILRSQLQSQQMESASKVVMTIIQTAIWIILALFLWSLVC